MQNINSEPTFTEGESTPNFSLRQRELQRELWENENLSEEQKKAHRAEVRSIREYKDLATPENKKFGLTDKQINDTSDPRLSELRREAEGQFNKQKESYDFERTHLVRVRAELGLQPTENIPSLTERKEHMAVFQDIMKRLDEELQNRKSKEKIRQEKGTQEQMTADRGREVFQENLRDVTREFSIRREEGFNQLFSSEDVLSGIARDIESLDSKQEDYGDKLVEQIQRMVRVLENPYTEKVAYRDSVDSLGRLQFRFNGLLESIRDLQDFSNKDIRSRIVNTQITDKIENTIVGIGRMRQRLKDYLEEQ